MFQVFLNKVIHPSLFDTMRLELFGQQTPECLQYTFHTAAIGHSASTSIAFYISINAQVQTRESPWHVLDGAPF